MQSNMANNTMTYETQDAPPVKPPRKYQLFEMSQSLGNEIKVCNYNPDAVSPPTLELLQCSSSSGPIQNKYNPDDPQRMNQIDTLAEELRQTSLKNVNTKKSYGNNNNQMNNNVPAEPKPKQRSRRPSGQWKITSVTIEESNTNNVHSESKNSVSSSEQVVENHQASSLSSYQQFQQSGHVNKFMEGGYQFQQESAQSTMFQNQGRVTGHKSCMNESIHQQSTTSNVLSSSSGKEMITENGNSEVLQSQQCAEKNSPKYDQKLSKHENTNSSLQQNMSQYDHSNTLFQQNISQQEHTNSQLQTSVSQHERTISQLQQNIYQLQLQENNSKFQQKMSQQEHTNFQQSQQEQTNSQLLQNMSLHENTQLNQKRQFLREGTVDQSNSLSKEQVTSYNGNGEKKKGDEKGSMKYIPNYMSLCPKPSEYNNHAEENGNGEQNRGRRNSVCQSFLNTDQTKSRTSRASSVDPQSRPIFSYLKLGEDPNAHRSRQPSNLASRRNSNAGLQKYSSQEYLNRAHCEMSDLKIRNNPVMLAQPKDMKDDENCFLSRDGSMYQSTEALNSGTRTRHRSASQSREDKSYTWSGRNSLTGTGLRIGSAVTEPEPKDGLALSKDGGFFMPFGNSENISKKCKTRRQLKAEEELRKQQEAEEERQSLLERQRKKDQRKEKRNRNRTISVSAQNRNNQINEHSNNILKNNTVVLNNMQDNSTTDTKANIVVENNSLCNAKVISEVENIQVLKKDDTTDKDTVDISQETNESQKKDTTSTNTTTTEENSFEYQRNTNWQKFGAEYNEFGELISCGKEPVGKYDSINLDGYEKRDRSNAFWHEGEGYEGCADGYGKRSDGSHSMQGRWDNVQRGPVLHASANPEIVPTRSFLSCSREPLTGHDSTMDLTLMGDRRGRREKREETRKARCASLDTRPTNDYSDILAGYSARSRQASVERGSRSRWSKEGELRKTDRIEDQKDKVISNGYEDEDEFRTKRRQAGALLKDLDLSLGQLENMVENKKKLSH